MKKQDLILMITVWLIWNVLFYFAISFYRLDLNPFTWPEDARLLFIWMGWLCGMPLSALVNMTNKQQN